MSLMVIEIDDVGCDQLFKQQHSPVDAWKIHENCTSLGIWEPLDTSKNIMLKDKIKLYKLAYHQLNKHAHVWTDNMRE